MNAYGAVFGWGYVEMVEIILDFLIRVASVGQYIKSMRVLNNFEYSASEYTLVTQVLKNDFGC
jgi:hypothetical protein